MEKEKVVKYFIDVCKIDEESATDNYFKLKDEIDIFEEMCEVIENSAYPEYPIVEEGYSAQILSEIFKLNVLESYNLLYLLRIDPEQALENIEKGLPNKEIVSEEIIKDDISKFDYIIGLDDIKQQILDFEKYIDFSIKTKRSNGIKMYYNIVFSGYEGSGKTLTSLEIAKILYEKKLIAENSVTECNFYDFIGESLEDTKHKTELILNKTSDKLLYILDTQNFNSEYGKVALNIIFKNIKAEKNIIIFGMNKEYTKIFLEYDIFNKIYDIFEFNGYSVENLFKIYEKKMNDNRITLEGEVAQKIQEVINYFYETNNFSYGKFVDLLIRLTLIKHSKQYKQLKTINIEEIPEIEEIERYLSI